MIQVETDAKGLASCRWRLAADPGCERVEAWPRAWRQCPCISRARRRSEMEEPGIRVKEVRLRGSDATLEQRRGAMRQLILGIDVVATDEIDPRSAKRPTCFVTVEDPFVVNRQYNIGGPPAAYVPLVLAAQVTVQA